MRSAEDTPDPAPNANFCSGSVVSNHDFAQALVTENGKSVEISFA